MTSDVPLLDDLERSCLKFLVDRLNAGSQSIAREQLREYLEELDAGERLTSITEYFRSLGILKIYPNRPYPKVTRALTPDNPETHKVISWHSTRFEGWLITGGAVEVFRALQRQREDTPVDAWTEHPCGLLVDHERRRVRRTGCDGKVDLSTTSLGWHIFSVALDAAPEQALEVLHFSGQCNLLILDGLLGFEFCWGHVAQR